MNIDKKINDNVFCEHVEYTTDFKNCKLIITRFEFLTSSSIKHLLKKIQNTNLEFMFNHNKFVIGI